MKKYFYIFIKADALIIMGITALFSMNISHAASYDCAKAYTNVEHMICEDAELSEKDSAMAELYFKYLEHNNNHIVKNSQIEWIKKRNLCKSKGCLNTLYDERITELKNEYEDSTKLDKSIMSKLPICPNNTFENILFVFGENDRYWGEMGRGNKGSSAYLFDEEVKRHRYYWFSHTSDNSKLESVWMENDEFINNTKNRYKQNLLNNACRVVEDEISINKPESNDVIFTCTLTRKEPYCYSPVSIKKQLQRERIYDKAELVEIDNKLVTTAGELVSGIVIEYNNENNKTVESNYSNGVLHGLQTAWHENGNIKYKVNYINGIRQDNYIEYTSDGIEIIRENKIIDELNDREAYVDKAEKSTTENKSYNIFTLFNKFNVNKLLHNETYTELLDLLLVILLVLFIFLIRYKITTRKNVNIEYKTYNGAKSANDSDIFIQPSTGQTVILSKQQTKATGIIAGIISCILALLGLFTFGLIFIPIAVIVAIIGSIRAIMNINISGIGINILAWVLIFIGIIFSPFLIVFYQYVIGKI